MDPLYRIVFSGQLTPGKTIQTTVPELAAKFRMRQEAARDLILGGDGKTLKKNLPREKAERYFNALTRIGLVVRMEPQDPELAIDEPSVLHPYAMEPYSQVIMPEDDNMPPTPDPDQEPMESAPCPKCGAMQVSAMTGICQACGVIAERYRAAHGQGGVSTAKASDNPYAAPQANLAPPPAQRISDSGLQPPRGVGMAHGWEWIGAGWQLFKEQPLPWIGALILFYVIIIALGIVPFAGGIITTILGPILTGGLMMGAHGQYHGNRFQVSHLFAGFSHRGGPLAMVGVLYMVSLIPIGLVMIAIIAVSAMPAYLSGGINAVDGMDPTAMSQMLASPAIVIGFLVALLLIIPVVMGMFFAPQLVAIDEVPVMRAFKLSFLGCWRNILPFLLYGVMAFLLLFLGMIPIFLGLIVVMPLLCLSIYSSYRDIFHYEPAGTWNTDSSHSALRS